MSKYTWQKIKHNVHDVSGIENPNEWLWKENDGVFYPVEKIECIHENAQFFHENAPMHCPDCNNYIDGDKILNLK